MVAATAELRFAQGVARKFWSTPHGTHGPMAIDPPSDIVLEVARAADPERAAAVARRLTKLAAPGGDPGADFAAALGQTSPATSAASAAVAGAPDMRARLTNIAHAHSDKARQAQVQFEAVLLNSFVG